MTKGDSAYLGLTQSRCFH